MPHGTLLSRRSCHSSPHLSPTTSGSGGAKLLAVISGENVSNMYGRRLPPGYTQSPYTVSLDDPTTSALRCGGFCTPTCHCTTPPYDMPHMPTFPSHHGCCASHSTIS